MIKYKLSFFIKGLYLFNTSDTFNHLDSKIVEIRPIKKVRETISLEEQKT